MDANYGRLNEYYNATLQWLVAYQSGFRLDTYLNSMGIKTIAVYGMNDIGNCIVRELISNDKVSFLYAIDQGAPKLYFDIDCCTLEELADKPVPDMVIVAVPHIFTEVRKDIIGRINTKVISITQLVYDMCI